MRPIAMNEVGNACGATVAATLYANAAPVPSAISVHMFGLRSTIDRAPRTKNGAPAHSTIGSESTSSIHVRAPGSSPCMR